MSSPRSSRRARAIAIAAGLVAVGVGVAAISVLDLDPPPAPAGRYYPIQLHLHGSMSEGNASMRAHNTVAHELGTVDALWWTDHEWRIAGHGHLPGFDFDEEVQRFPIPYRETYRARWRESAVKWEEESEPGIEEIRTRLVADQVAQGSRALAINVRAKPGAGGWQWAGVEIVNASGRLKASLAADVVVELLVHPLSTWSGNSRLVVRFDLSYQTDAFSELVYVLGSRGEPRIVESRRRRSAYVPIEAPVGQWSRLEMNLTRDARAFDLGGWDNSLRKIRIGARVRRGESAAILVDHLRVVRHRKGPEVLTRAEEIAAGLEEEIGLVNLVGLEISYSDHMNAYLPRIEMPDLDRHPHGMTPQEIVAWVHEREGVTSYNHVFGAVDRQADEYEYRTRRLFENRAFGADLLEVGYPHRVFPLARHLEVWDRLSGDRVVIGGVGTSDSHNFNQGWKAGNNYVTWVWSRSAGQLDLIEALRSRHAFFGDPVLFRGELRLETADGIPMGQVIRTTKGHHDAILSVTDLPPGTEVRWIEQGEATRVLEPPAGDFTERFRVDTTSYRFVRAEIWKGERGLAFSNCLYFVPGDPEERGAPP